MSVVAPRPSWPTDPDGTPLYAGTCKHLSQKERERRLAAGEKASYRLDMERALRAVDHDLTWTEYRETGHPTDQAASPATWGDAVLARRDIATSYHIAVVIDDAAQGITDVVRGEDLFQATSLHRLLQDLLDLPAPAYHHHRLLRDAAGQKLAKSLRAKSLRTFPPGGPHAGRRARAHRRCRHGRWVACASRASDRSSLRLNLEQIGSADVALATIH